MYESVDSPEETSLLYKNIINKKVNHAWKFEFQDAISHYVHFIYTVSPGWACTCLNAPSWHLTQCIAHYMIRIQYCTISDMSSRWFWSYQNSLYLCTCPACIRTCITVPNDVRNMICNFQDMVCKFQDYNVPEHYNKFLVQKGVNTVWRHKPWCNPHSEHHLMIIRPAVRACPLKNDGSNAFCACSIHQKSLMQLTGNRKSAELRLDFYLRVNISSPMV